MIGATAAVICIIWAIWKADKNTQATIDARRRKTQHGV